MNPELSEVIAILNRLETKLNQLLATGVKSSPAAVNVEAASDEELDGQYGDPEIRRDPPKWEGPSYAGQHMSSVPDPTYLKKLAGFLLWQATKDEERGDDKSKKNAWYSRQRASMALGWARRAAANVGKAALGRIKDAFGTDDDQGVPF
jgi:hypothetical protein